MSDHPAAPAAPAAAPAAAELLDWQQMPVGERVERRFTIAGVAAQTLAARAQIPEVGPLTAFWQVTRTASDTVLSEGHLQGQVVLTCRASGEPFQHPVDTRVRVRHVAEAELVAAAGGDDDDDGFGDGAATRMTIDPDPTTDVEPLPDGPLDLSEAAAQALLLDLPAWPRRPDVAPVSLRVGESEDEAAAGPLAGALARFRRPADER